MHIEHDSFVMQGIIARLVQPVIEQALTAQAAVAIIGPRQVGKTTLAREIADSRPGSLYLDLEAREDREKLSEPVLFLKQYERVLSRERSVIPKGLFAGWADSRSKCNIS